MDKLTKQPAEVIRFGWDFVQKLPDGDTVSSVVSSVVTPTGELTTSDFVISGAQVSALHSGGMDSKTYISTIIVTTTGGETLEHEFKVKIKEK